MSLVRDIGFHAIMYFCATTFSMYVLHMLFVAPRFVVCRCSCGCWSIFYRRAGH